MASSADLLQKNFYRDLIYAPLDAAGTPNTDLLVKIVQIIVPNVAAVPADKVSVKEINGGITNALFRVQGGDTAVRVRIFGGEGDSVRLACLFLPTEHIQWFCVRHD